MADDVSLPATGAQVATDEVDMGGGAAHVQLVKLVDGTDGATGRIPGDANGLHVQPGKGSFTDGSTTITTGGTSQQVFAANAARRFLLVQNISDTKMFLNFGSAATTGAGSILLAPNGGSVVMDAGFVTDQTVNILCATAGKAFTAKEA